MLKYLILIKKISFKFKNFYCYILILNKLLLNYLIDTIYIN